MKIRHLFTAFTILALLSVLPSHTFAQINVTANDFLGLIGSRQVLLEDGRSNIPVNVGSPGANQVWDFRSMVIGDTVVVINEFFSPGDTPSASTFPSANFVEKISNPEEPGFAIFSFYRFTNDNFINLGDITTLSDEGLDTTFVRFKNDTIAPLPIEFNDSWVTSERDTTGFFPFVANISIDTTFNSVDGWGTVRLPMGDFECLRLRQDVRVINQSILNGQISSISTETTIDYVWISKNSFLLASVESQDGETNPNFTDARGFAILDETTASPPTSVENSGDLTQIPSAFELSQNYPNPFNPETVIHFSLPEPSSVEIAIFNMLGQKIQNLSNTRYEAGIHSISWNGKDQNGNFVSSGVYLYQLRAGSFLQVKKMTLLR